MADNQISLDEIYITNTRIEHGEGVYDTVRLAYGETLDRECGVCINPDDVKQQIERFPEGQFVAVHRKDDDEIVVGMACTMRTDYSPYLPAQKWMKAIGTKGIANHVPDGEWLYGVEMTVRPSYRRKGIGTALYKARFELVKQLNLKAWYIGGMLMGYRGYRHELSAKEYGEKVIQREIVDPTVTMQMNRGFVPLSVIENYLDEPLAGDAAILAIWENPDFKE